MKRYIKIKKQLSSQEAKIEIQKCQNMIEVLLESINSWNTYVSPVILMVITQEFGSLENAINENNNLIEWNKQKIEDLTRFII